MVKMSNNRQQKTIIIILGAIAVLLIVIACGVITLVRKPEAANPNALHGVPQNSKPNVLPVADTSQAPVALSSKPLVQQQANPPDETAALRQAVLAALPNYVAEYHTVNRMSAQISVHNVSISQTSSTEAVGIMKYTASSGTGSSELAARCQLRKYDTGWKAETIEPD